jgi:hypothetical protein
MVDEFNNSVRHPISSQLDTSIWNWFRHEDKLIIRMLLFRQLWQGLHARLKITIVHAVFDQVDSPAQ